MSFQRDLVPTAFVPAQPLTSSSAFAFVDVIDGDPTLILPAANTPSARSVGFTLPDDYAGGTITARFFVAMASATAGNVQLDLQWRRFGLTSDRAFATAQTATIARGSTPGDKQTLDITFTSAQIDGATAGELVQLRLSRRNDVGSNAAGNAWITGCQLFEA